MLKLFKKKSCCPAACSQEAMDAAARKIDGDAVLVLGTGCAKCAALEKNAKQAVKELGLTTAVDHITDLAQIAGLGVMTTPALMVRGKVVSSGKVLSAEDIKKFLK